MGREAAKTHRVSWSGTKNTLRLAGDSCTILNALTLGQMFYLHGEV